MTQKWWCCLSSMTAHSNDNGKWQATISPWPQQQCTWGIQGWQRQAKHVAQTDCIMRRMAIWWYEVCGAITWQHLFRGNCPQVPKPPWMLLQLQRVQPVKSSPVPEECWADLLAQLYCHSGAQWSMKSWDVLLPVPFWLMIAIAKMMAGTTVRCAVIIHIKVFAILATTNLLSHSGTFLPKLLGYGPWCS